MKAIIVDSITKEYGGRPALGPISFEVSKNSIHGFLGPNGAGKSTTFKIIAGLLQATSGNVYVDGLPLHEKTDEIKRLIGILPENAPLMNDMKVEDYLLYVCRLHGVGKKQALELVDKVIKKLSLEEVQKRLIGNLSKGYRQRVGIAQAIVFGPKIILLDEPTVGLDPASVIEMRELIRELKNDHTILFSSHLLHEVELICDEVTIINKGEKIYSGDIASVTRAQEKSTSLRILSSLKNINNFPELTKAEVLKISQEGEYINISIQGDKEKASQVVKELMELGIEIYEFQINKNDLEKAFLELVSGHLK